jgi:hypothetical protein
MAEAEKREKRSRKSYDDRDELSVREAGSKTLRKLMILNFLMNPRDAVITVIKEVRKLDYKKLMEKYFTVQVTNTMES